MKMLRFSSKTRREGVVQTGAPYVPNAFFALLECSCTSDSVCSAQCVGGFHLYDLRKLGVKARLALLYKHVHSVIIWKPHITRRRSRWPDGIRA
jgi:hypothetical protein